MSKKVLLEPNYYIDPATYYIHKRGSCCKMTENYAYIFLTAALKVGGEPCPVCLPDWEEIVAEEKSSRREREEGG